jgi:diaminopimelate epimerase
MIRFTKGHGTENDFVIVEDAEAGFDPDTSWVASVCDRRAGIGADGLLRVVPTKAMPGFERDAATAPWFMDYRNADGSVAEMCGNGVRVFARYLVEQGLARPGRFGVATRGGVKSVVVPEDGVGDITVDMGLARWPGGAAEVLVGGRWLPSVNVDMGNPHAVVFVDDVAEAGKLTQRPELRPAQGVYPQGAYPEGMHPQEVYPQGVNVEFVVSTGEHRIAMRVFERGVGETRSCGTGACAAMLAAARRDGAAPGTAYEVRLPGGVLSVVELEDGRVEMTGPAVLVAAGELLGG